MQSVIYEALKEHKTKLSVVGLGYVGLPLAVSFGNKVDVVGFDVSSDKIALYRQGRDVTGEVGDKALEESYVNFTNNATDLREATFHIVAVPTPVNNDHTPDLLSLREATAIVGRNLSPGSIVVYESTVYPGVTEEVCTPILERESKLKCGVDFKIGYSPERINPGDKSHRLENIVKIVSGMDDETLDVVAQVYSLIINVGVYRAESIKVAEAAKVIENSQRDINIAFMNELSVIFNKMGIDTKSVLEAANTKWNFLRFSPGLDGGHCIGVDPYYLTYKAEVLGYHPEVILAGRRINDNMGKYVAEQTIKCLIKADKPVKKATVFILGFTFKENCQDTRNSKVYDIVRELTEYGIEPIINDPVANVNEAQQLYGLSVNKNLDCNNADAIIVAVAHDDFTQIPLSTFNTMYGKGRKILVDVKGIFDRKKFEQANYIYWRL